jgi:uncharacterized glyoxalase superfamily protein PhnB
MAKAPKPIPEGFHTVTPQLVLDNGAQAIEFYKRAFGAEEINRHLGPDGKIMHAMMKIGDSFIMMNDAMMGSPKSANGYGGSPVSLWLYVSDCDALFKRATAAGAEVRVPLADQFWGDRGGAVTDPEGYTWWIATHKEELTPAELEERTREFFKQMAPSATH